VTFAYIKNYEKELKDVDHYLEQYSSLSSPSLVHGDEKKEEFIEQGKHMTAADGKRKGSKEQPAVDKYDGMVVPPEVVTSDGKQV
jgi:spartin